MNENILLPYDMPEVLYKFHRLPIVNGRLTLTTGVPVTTSDVTSAGTIYFTPYNGNYISLWNGDWNVYSFEEASLSISSLTASTLYNVYGYWGGQSLVLETSTTTTATQDGRLVMSGDPTRLYLGSIYTSGAGTTEDSGANRLVWNYYNRRPRKIRKYDSTAHYYNTATFRAWNNDTSVNAKFVVGAVEDPIDVAVMCDMTPATEAVIGVGLNSSSTAYTFGRVSTGTGRISMAATRLTAYPTAGLNTLYPLEYSNGNSYFRYVELAGYVMG